MLYSTITGDCSTPKNSFLRPMAIRCNDEAHLVLVTVEPEGFPAKPHVPERKFIIFNIVCDELLLGIPYKAWWVVALALLCLGVAFAVPCFLPLYLLPKNQVLQSDRVSKTS
ncbi:hypothetical protein KIW84_030550 [Lathyrus oleraceus]|uniref:Uncharacterized protein n=1 Tax=Pisum sativum TaxID=3888 RepID=A0A9D5AWD0_PEA|nr:hypothetical protein KIW84_030550 [Pisum sativum]